MLSVVRFFFVRASKNSRIQLRGVEPAHMPQWGLDPAAHRKSFGVMATRFSSGVMAPMSSPTGACTRFKQILREAFFHQLAENRNRLALDPIIPI